MSGNATALVRAAAPDVLSNAMQYTLANTASYIMERRGTKFQPLGGASYNPTLGTRLIRFVISDQSAFLDVSSVALSFRLRNLSADPLARLRLRGPPQVLISRARMLCKGTVIEDLHEVPHLVTLLRYVDTEERQENDAILSYWDEGGDFGERVEVGIPGGAGRRIMCDLRFFGLFRIDKHIPLLHAPITLELYLQDGVEAFYPAMAAVGAPANLAAVPRSQTYALEDVHIKCDLLTLSPNLVKMYDDLLSKKGNFPIAFTSFATTRHQLLASPEQDIQTTRSLALCKSAFLVFTHQNRAQIDALPARFDGNAQHSSWNLFLNPRWESADDMTDAEDGQFSWQLKVGGNAWPVNAVEGTGAESWYQLRNTLDMSMLGFNQIRARDWMTSKWMAAIDLEKAASTLDNLSFTGQPLRSGEPVTFSIRGLDPLAANRPTMAFLTLVYDAFVNIHEAGCDISY